MIHGLVGEAQKEMFEKLIMVKVSSLPFISSGGYMSGYIRRRGCESSL
jgi:hypothetical protein